VSKDPTRGQERACPLQTSDGGVAAPLPLAGIGAEAGPDRVEGEVARKFQQVPVALDEYRVESPLEDVAVQRVKPVERLGKSAIEPLHARGQICPRRLENQVVVVRHQAVAEPAPSSRSRELVDKEEKPEVVILIEKDLLASVAPTRDVKDAVGDLMSMRARHALTVGRRPLSDRRFRRSVARLLAFCETSGVRPRAWPLGTRAACRYTHPDSNELLGLTKRDGRA